MTECMHLVAEFAAPQHAFFAKTQKPGQVVGRFALVQLAPHSSPVIFIVDGLQNVNRLLNPADFRESLVDAVLAGIGAQPVKHQRRRNNPFSIEAITRTVSSQAFRIR